MTPTLSAPATTFRAAADRALDFIAAHIDLEGRSTVAPNDPALHFKLPYVFSYGDRRDIALRVLEHLEHDLLSKRGAFIDNAFNGPKSSFLYQAGWLAWSSAALGRFDLARLIAQRMMQEQDQQLGGFWNETELGHVQWLLNSSSALAGCAAAGELPAAKSAARQMALLFERQPAPEQGFYFSMTGDGQVLAELGDEPNRNFFDLDGPCRPAMFATAIAGLTWLGRQTRTEEYFDLARAYAGVILSHRARPEHSHFASKTGWAILQLAANRPEPTLITYAQAVGQRFLELQLPDGSVNLTDWPGLETGGPLPLRLANLCDWSLTAVALANEAA